MPTPTQLRQGALLLRSCLRLHRKLPNIMRNLGDVYVKKEFRLHRKFTCTVEQYDQFLNAWRQYEISIEAQPEVKGEAIPRSVKLQMSPEQRLKLRELREEVKLI
eukprot:GEMP01080091.1.p3 GENE.GEMP01080091.1~~GEMP01080091.1.p3  ORF type:complete len:105 (+),score=21.57 GEMP01080091.1:105-419(+)